VYRERYLTVFSVAPGRCRRCPHATLSGCSGSNLQSYKDQLATSSIRVLLVDDFEPFRRFVYSTLQDHPDLQIIGEVWDGLESVQRAEELQPDLILLDIGLPNLSGIEAARRIRSVAPQSKILFISEHLSPDMVQGALSTGACGYVVKADAARDLLDAVIAVLRGEQFIGKRFAGDGFSSLSGVQVSAASGGDGVLPQPQQQRATAPHHEVGLYTEDKYFLDDVTQFIGAALRAGRAAIVVATELHRDELLARLHTEGLDIGALIEQGRYIAVDAADALSTFMVDAMPDSVRFMTQLGNLLVTATQAAKGGQGRVAIFGECVQLLWAQGNAEAAIQLERLGNQLATTYDVDILCGYSVGDQGGADSHFLQRVCAEHSDVHSR
jgi:DNA-binding NarL/FixJ family response regulator